MSENAMITNADLIFDDFGGMNGRNFRLACYDTVKGVVTHDLEWDMSNDGELYLRVVD